MANFARIDSNNKVIDIIAISNRDCGGGNFPESEPIGQRFINDVLNIEGKWLQTSYNNSFRRNYAGLDGYYCEEKDAFIYKKPFDSWLLNDETLIWEPPVPHPEDGNDYYWDEMIKNWKKFEIPEDFTEQLELIEE